MNLRMILIALVLIAATVAVLDMLALAGFGTTPDAGPVTQVETGR